MKNLHSINFNPEIKNQVFDLFSHLINNVGQGMAGYSLDGTLILENELASLLLGKTDSKIRKELKKQIRVTKETDREIIKDHPLRGRVLRLHTQILSLPAHMPLVLVIIRDATDEWISERQKEVLEHTANSFSQEIPTKIWMQSILDKMVVMMGIRGCNLMICKYEQDKLLKIFEAGEKNLMPKSENLRNSIPGLAATKKTHVAVYGDDDPKTGYSLLSIPMIVGEKTLGVLNLIDDKDKLFREHDRAFYTILANRLGITLEYRSVIKKLKNAHARINTILTNSDHAMILVDQKHNIEIANPAFGKLVHKELVKIEGKKLEQIAPEFSEILKEKTAYRKKYTLKLNSLKAKPWIQATKIKIVARGGQNTVIIIRDITEEKELEQSKNDFIATATHELRTPLTAIRGYLSIVEQKYGHTEPKLKFYLNRMQDASDNLAELIEDLLSILRIEQNKTIFEPAKVDLNKILDDIVKKIEPRLDQKNIKLAKPQKEAVVWADKNSLEKVFSNLIDNAVKYTFKNGEIAVKFKDVNKKNEKCIQVCVEDSGVGIPEEKQSQLFEKFSRIPNELSIEAGGTGLGLYISKKLAEKWGGDLRLVKSNQKGSTFCFTVPAFDEHMSK